MPNASRKPALLAVFYLILIMGCGSVPSRDAVITRTDSGLIDRARAMKDSPGLRFPFDDPYAIVKVRCFGLHPWSADGERHGGIDIIPRYERLLPGEKHRYRIVAPARGRVVRIVTGTTGAGAPSLTVVLEYNSFWYGLLTFEPQSLDEKVFKDQSESIKVFVGKMVEKGGVIGDLVVCNVIPGIPPHLHYGLLYKQPEHSLDYIYAHYLEIARSDGSHLPPVIGPGSPSTPRNLGLPSTVFCPYEYSSPRARGCFDSYPKLNAVGTYCCGVCAYRSHDGNCGDAGCRPSLPAR